ncbi:MAG: RluA family pseudouridine synthase [Kiritimatiellia bacterium]
MRGPDILFEDPDILVVDKPAGMFVHPSPGHETGTLTDALLKRCPSMAGVGSAERPGVVHRLDADTSGVMVLAKTQRAYLKLRELFESHRDIRKTYLAVCHGAPTPKEGRLETTIGRKPWDAKRMAVDVPDGKRAVTEWTVLGRQGPVALVEFRIETGRTHQIRVHAAHLGHPLAGDPLYGDAAKDRRLRTRPVRTLLHAVELSFPHPVTGRRLTFAAEPPADILYAS